MWEGVRGNLGWGGGKLKLMRPGAQGGGGPSDQSMGPGALPASHLPAEPGATAPSPPIVDAGCVDVAGL